MARENDFHDRTGHGGTGNGGATGIRDNEHHGVDAIDGACQRLAGPSTERNLAWVA